MSSVKELKVRLVGVETIQKITRAMKMVSAARLRTLQRVINQVVVGMKIFPSFFQGDAKLSNEKTRFLLPISSERGLCGSVNTSINKSIMYSLNDLHQRSVDTEVFIIGQKSRDFFLRNCGNSIIRQIDQMSPNNVNFVTASLSVEELLYNKFDQVSIFFNLCESVVSQRVYSFHVKSFSLAQKDFPQVLANELDDATEDINALYSDLYQFGLVFLFIYVLIQSKTAEQASRVSAMENATKNAGEIIQTLRLVYNKARQSAITRELIEIISCANALTGSSRRE
uniref:ATP synthase F1 subunit gamma n=1 Tax=Tsukubamonas globosa TaxID=875863 RepID=W8VY33_9EUKA|nr:ATP synthase F1 subunit gamma [Tsukubamonas globosa]BAO51962.1 ATP synthase F1 subunit gamma [Tsukubamonas globosa]